MRKYIFIKITDSSEYKNKFVEKFGNELYDLFFKYKSSLKSPYNDITWLIKNCSKEELNEYILKQVICKGFDIYTEDENYLVYYITNSKMISKLAPETTWCIKKEKAFNFYESKGAVNYLLVSKKNPSIKYVITYMEFDPENSATLTDINNDEIDTIPNQTPIDGIIFHNQKHPDLHSTLSLWLKYMSFKELHYIFDDLCDFDSKEELNNKINEFGMKKIANYIDDHLEEQDTVYMNNRMLQRKMYEALMEMQ